MNEFVLQTFVAINVATGEPVTWDLDEVKCNGRRVAFVPHKVGAGIRLLAPMSGPTLATLVDFVKTEREKQGKPAISDTVAMPPEPEELRKAAAKLRKGA